MNSIYIEYIERDVGEAHLLPLDELLPEVYEILHLDEPISILITNIKDVAESLDEVQVMMTSRILRCPPFSLHQGDYRGLNPNTAIAIFPLLIIIITAASLHRTTSDISWRRGEGRDGGWKGQSRAI